MKVRIMLVFVCAFLLLGFTGFLVKESNAGSVLLSREEMTKIFIGRGVTSNKYCLQLVDTCWSATNPCSRKRNGTLCTRCEDTDPVQPCVGSCGTCNWNTEDCGRDYVGACAFWICVGNGVDDTHCTFNDCQGVAQ